MIKRNLNINLLIYLTAVIPLLYLIALIISGFYAHPIPEDFGIASISRKAGIINAAIHRFYTFDGRYATNFFHGLTPLVWASVKYYFIAPLFFIASFVFAWYYFLRIVYKDQSFVIIIAYSLIISAVFYGVTPHVTVWMYQAAGSIVYGLSGSVFLLFAASLIRLYEEKTGFRQLRYLIQAVLLMTVAVGLNELIMVVINILLGFLFCYALIVSKYRSRISDILILLTVCLSCTFFVLSAPGIGQDVGMDFNAGFNYKNIIVAFIKSLTYTSKYIVRWIIATPLVLFVYFLIEVIHSRGLSLKALLFAPLIAIPLSFLLISICNLTYIIPFNNTVTFNTFPYRTFSTGLLIYMIIFILTVRYFSKVKFKQQYLNHELSVKKKVVVIIVVCVFTFLFISQNNVKMLINNWQSGLVKQYNRQMNERYQAIDASKRNHKETVILKVIEDHPSAIIDNVDINCTEDGSGWLRAYRNYFDIKVQMDCTVINDSVTKN